MKTARLVAVSIFLLTTLFFIGSNKVLADISNTLDTNTISDPYGCSNTLGGAFQGYQYLGQGLSGSLSEVHLKLLNPGPVYYGKSTAVRIYESDTYLNNYSDIYNSNLVWAQGESLDTRININNFDGIISFNNPDLGSSFNFLPTKHYYLLPTFFSNGGGSCQFTYFYGSLNSGSYQTGEFYSDPFVKDIYFDLKGLSYSSTTPTGNSNVLFIPGLEASRLYEKKTILGIPVEDQLWEPTRNSDVQELYLNQNGTSIGPNIYTRDIIKETNSPIQTGPAGQNIYKSFSTMMDGLVGEGKIVAWQAYSYDWRQGVQDIVYNGTKLENKNYTLTEAVQSLATASQNGKVTIIAHSNGGLIAKALLKKLKDDKSAGTNNLIDKIDTVILVASPQLGTPTVLPVLLHGYDMSMVLNILLNPSTARELGRNMPSAYGLLPSAEYFNKVATPVVSFVPNIFDPYISRDITTYGQNISTYNSERSFILGGEGRTNPIVLDTFKPILGNVNLLTQAENLHASIDNLTLPSSIRVVQIAGWGLNTISGFQYNASTSCSSVNNNGCTGSYVLDQRPIFTIDGDKTVVTPSALAMGGEKYWVNIEEHNAELGALRRNRQHKDILEINQVNKFIVSIITDQPPLYDLVFSTTQPIDTKNRLRLSVHSPMTLDAYDNLGGHTGKVCPETTDLCYLEENIPNSSYYEFGEGKYLNLTQDDLQKVKLQGTDIGTFTFESQLVNPSGQTTSTFVDIPVTTQTQAEVTLNITGTPQLKLDVTGDGVVDFTLAPNSTFDPVTYLQIMKTTVDSLDLTDAKKKAFGNRVDNIIKLIQKGKIDKAKLKADKFKSVLENKLSKPDPKHPKPKKLSKTDAQLLLDMLNGLLDNLG